MSHHLPQPHALTELDLMQIKREQQRLKTRERMARHRQRLKEMPLELQAAAQTRARDARTRYRHSRRIERALAESAAPGYIPKVKVIYIACDNPDCERWRASMQIQNSPLHILQASHNLQYTNTLQYANSANSEGSSSGGDV